MSDKAALEGAHATLSGDGTVTGLVGTRIYRGAAPQSATLPYLVLKIISVSDEHLLGGGADISNRRIQATAWADTAAGRDALADAAYEAMVAAGHYRIAAVGFHNEETGRFQSAQDFSVWSSR